MGRFIYSNHHQSQKWAVRLSFFSIVFLFCGLVFWSQRSSFDRYSESASRGLATVESSHPKNFDYLEILDLTRKLLSRKSVQDFLKNEFEGELRNDQTLLEKFEIADPRGIDMTETQMVLLLQNNPEVWPDLKNYLQDVPADAPLDDPTRILWQEKFRAIFANPELRSEFSKLNNPTEALHLATEDGQPSIRKMKLSVGHVRNFRGQKIPKDDLSLKIIEFIASAQEEIIFNVFDFDHEEIADAFIRAHKRGIKVMGGIDNKNVIQVKAEVKAVYEKLKAAGLHVEAIDSVGLNHQKLIAVDWSLKGKGRALLSSGNFTHSGLDPKGDLHLVPDNLRPNDSVPNANHLITLDSDLVAQLIHHQLDKTINYKMKGAEFPISGVFRLLGLNKSGKEFPFYLTFTPGGAYRNVNENLIAKVIEKGNGPIEMAQFAFSSKAVLDALYKRAAREIKETDKFDFRSVGHAGFAMQFWSGFLEMSGLARKTDGPEEGLYIVDPDSRWRNLFSSDTEFDRFRENIRLGPIEYRDMNWVEYIDQQGAKQKVSISAKVHHKSLVSGGELSKYEWVIAGSFNFSEGAEGNNEQIFVIRDPEFAEEFHGIIDALYEKSPSSVLEDAKRRNLIKIDAIKRTGMLPELLPEL